MKNFISTLALLVSTAVVAKASDITWFAGRNGDIVIQLSNTIEGGDGQKLQRILDGHAEERIAGIILNSGGGIVGGAVELVEVIQTKKLETAVTSGSTCASACFFVFAAGNKK